MDDLNQLTQDPRFTGGDFETREKALGLFFDAQKESAADDFSSQEIEAERLFTLQAHEDQFIIENDLPEFKDFAEQRLKATTDFRNKRKQLLEAGDSEGLQREAISYANDLNSIIKAREEQESLYQKIQQAAFDAESINQKTDPTGGTVVSRVKSKASNFIGDTIQGLVEGDQPVDIRDPKLDGKANNEGGRLLEAKVRLTELGVDPNQRETLFADQALRINRNFEGFFAVDSTGRIIEKTGSYLLTDDELDEKVSSLDAPFSEKKRLTEKIKQNRNQIIDYYSDVFSKNETIKNEIDQSPGSDQREKLRNFVFKARNRSSSRGTLEKSASALGGSVNGLFGSLLSVAGFDESGEGLRDRGEALNLLSQETNGSQLVSDITGITPDLLLSLAPGGAAARLARAAGASSKIATGLSLAATSSTTGFLSGSRTFGEALDQGKSRKEAGVLALKQGAIEGLITALGGQSGVEALVTRGVGRDIANKSLFNTIKSFGSEAKKEAIEEFSAELLSGILVSSELFPDKKFSEHVSNAFRGAEIGAIIGGSARGVSVTIDAISNLNNDTKTTGEGNQTDLLGDTNEDGSANPNEEISNDSQGSDAEIQNPFSTEALSESQKQIVDELKIESTQDLDSEILEFEKEVETDEDAQALNDLKAIKESLTQEAPEVSAPEVSAPESSPVEVREQDVRQLDDEVRTEQEANEAPQETVDPLSDEGVPIRRDELSSVPEAEPRGREAARREAIPVRSESVVKPFTPKLGQDVKFDQFEGKLIDDEGRNAIETADGSIVELSDADFQSLKFDPGAQPTQKAFSIREPSFDERTNRNVSRIKFADPQQFSGLSKVLSVAKRIQDPSFDNPTQNQITGAISSIESRIDKLDRQGGETANEIVDNLIPIWQTLIDFDGQTSSAPKPETEPTVKAYGGFFFLDPEFLVSTARNVYRDARTIGKFSRELIRKAGASVRPIVKNLFDDLKETAGNLTFSFLQRTGGIQFITDPNDGVPNQPRKNPSPVSISPGVQSTALQRRSAARRANRESANERVQRELGREVLNTDPQKQARDGIIRQTIAGNFRQILQDKFLDLKNDQKQAEKNGGVKLTDDINAYQEQDLLSNAQGAQIQDFFDTEINTLLVDLSDNNINPDDVELLSVALHAKERNNAIFERDGQTDSGSGLSNSEAEAIINSFKNDGEFKKIKPFVDKLVRLNKGTLKKQLDSGLITQEAFDNISNRYKNYVPLRGKDGGVDSEKFETPTKGSSGISVKRQQILSAKGRSSIALDQISYTAQQRIASISDSLTNDANKALLGFTRTGKSKLFREVEAPKSVVLIDGQQVRTDDPNWVRRNVDSGNVILVKENGENKFIESLSPRFAKNWKNMGGETKSTFVKRYLQTFRFVSSLKTAYNPDFILPNFSRDIQTAVVNVSETEIKGIKKEVIKNVRGAGLAIFRNERGSENGEWSKWVDSFRKNGAKMEFFDLKSVEDIKRHVQSSIDGKNFLQKGLSRTGVKSVFDLWQNVNSAVENATRLSVFRSLVEKGNLSEKQAASFAVNVTVNFTKKGEAGPLLNGLYLFFNAAIQGNARILQAAKNSKSVRRILGGSVLLGASEVFINNAIGATDEETGISIYDLVPDYIKEGNLILALPENITDSLPEQLRFNTSAGAVLKLPLPYGYNVFTNIGKNATSASFGQKSAGDAAMSVVSSAINSFNPFGGIPNVNGTNNSLSEALAVYATPSLAKPFVENAVNLDGLGRPVAPEGNPFSQAEEPDSQRFFPGVSKFSKSAATSINKLTGGNDDRKGFIDFSPEHADHILESYLGGAFSFAKRVINTSSNVVSGEEIELSEIPIARRFISEVPEWQKQSIYYAAQREALTVKNEEKSGQTFNSGDKRWLKTLPLFKEANSKVRKLDKSNPDYKKKRSEVYDQTLKKIGEIIPLKSL